MQVYSFRQQPLRRNSFADARYVYNTPQHLALQANSGWVVFELLNPQKKVSARMCINVAAPKALSPVRAPFGSCEIYARVGVVALLHFFSFVEAQLRKKKVRQVVIRNWPSLYEPQQAEPVFNVLVHKLNFLFTSEVSSIIQVNRETLLSRMKISERQKAVKAAKLFSFNRYAAPQFKKVYEFIHTCRSERQQTLSLSWKQVKQTCAAFPDNFLFFSLTAASEMAAAAIVIKVNPKIWYTFYYAHDSKYNKVSPVVYLLSCIYEVAAKEKVKLLDLGTSMVNAEINKSLLHFKQSVGAETVSKFTFVKNY
ncbi:MAG: hypothetical protein J0L66_07130 [Cytophagales bacterium]|nr:hypothetical protein [Cytophagales bacterium]